MSYSVTGPIDTSPYKLTRVNELPDAAPEQLWLIANLWLAQAVGIIGAAPKMAKTWLALDMAVSVCTGTPCLGSFAVCRTGRVVVYSAEDDLTALKSRVRSICDSRNLSLDTLDMGFITAAGIDLSNPGDFHRLERCIEQNAPVLLVLDPFIRLYSGSEDDSSQVSRVLSLLRKLQRQYGVAIILVHHNAKRAEGNGHALRGSSDFFAWLDCGIYLKSEDGYIRLTAQHRSAAAPGPVMIRLNTDGPTHLEVVDIASTTTVPVIERSLQERILDVLQAGPLKRAEIREQLHVRNNLLKEPIDALTAAGRITSIDGKLTLSTDTVPPTVQGPDRNGTPAQHKVDAVPPIS
jgi:hypothetical protein